MRIKLYSEDVKMGDLGLDESIKIDPKEIGSGYIK
jgi:hypothetical protein